MQTTSSHPPDASAGSADTIDAVIAASRTLIEQSLAEDVGSGDLTSEACIPAEAQGRAIILSRQELVVCGHAVAELLFSLVDPSLRYRVLQKDGTKVPADTPMAEISGPQRGILTGERTALNFLQRLSGIATLTASLVELVAGTNTKLLDTRKTTPGWRRLEKYAVRVGGGVNHRVGLYDAVLIKNNHIDALGGAVADAVTRCRERSPKGTKIEVEVRNRAELLEALAAHPDAILLDNMSPSEIRDSVAVVRSTPGCERIELEASGGIRRENIRSYAETGVDSLSLGLLTHSAPAVDISLRHQNGGRVF